MPGKPLRVLALDPGIRYFGYAVLVDGELIYHGVRTLTGNESAQRTISQARSLVLEVIGNLKPTHLAIETFTGGRKTNRDLQGRVVSLIEHLAKARDLSVAKYAPATIRKFVCGTGWASKQEVILTVVKRHPELAVHFKSGRLCKEHLHGHMFDAVAVGWLAEDRLTEKRRRQKK